MWVYCVSKYALCVWILILFSPTGAVPHKFRWQKNISLLLLFLFPVFTLTSFSEHIDLENLSGVDGKLGSVYQLSPWPGFENVVRSALFWGRTIAMPPIPIGHFLRLHWTISLDGECISLRQQSTTWMQLDFIRAEMWKRFYGKNKTRFETELLRPPS